MLIPNKEIYHYGVKGMKWGVRKDRRKNRNNTTLAEDTKDLKEAVKRLEAAYSIRRKTKGVTNDKKLMRIITSADYNLFNLDQDIKKKYGKDYGVKQIFSKSRNDMRNHFEIKMPEIKHSSYMSPELYHYGVKGMKWGVRKDRRKTSVGEDINDLSNGVRTVMNTSGSSDKKVKKQNAEAKRLLSGIFKDIKKAKGASIISKKNKDTGKLEYEIKVKDKKIKMESKKIFKTMKESISDDPRKVYKHRKIFTDDELQTLAKRFTNENKIKNISLSNMKTAANYITTLTATATAVYSLYNFGKKVATEVKKNAK